jgi:hypothetical protein
MRINDILTESRSDEGIVSDIGSGVGKAVGATARGVGAVAGGVRGAWDAAKQGFQSGRNTVAGNGGGGAPPAATTGGGSNTDTQRAHDLRVQADQLDGGNSAQQTVATPTSVSRASGISRSGAGGQSTPYTGSGQTTTAPKAAAAPAGPDATLKKLQQSLQHLKGPDVERIRGMLKKRAGIAEGIMSKVAGGLGKMNRGYVDVKSAYQKGRGGSMTPQEIDLAIASMSKKQATQLLQFFDTLHPVAAVEPADAGTPAEPAAPAAAPAAANPQAALLALGGKNKSAPGTINGLTPSMTTKESRNLRIRSRFLDMDI